jgi:hypothetical protein
MGRDSEGPQTGQQLRGRNKPQILHFAPGSTLHGDIETALHYAILVSVEGALVDSLVGTSGVGAPNVSGDVNSADALITAVAELTAAGVQPTFCAISPFAFAEATKLREGADGAYITGNPSLRLPPVVQSIALDPGQALVGDSRIAAKLGIREPVRVFVGTEADDVGRRCRRRRSSQRWEGRGGGVRPRGAGAPGGVRPRGAPGGRAQRRGRRRTRLPARPRRRRRSRGRAVHVRALPPDQGNASVQRPGLSGPAEALGRDRGQIDP